MNFIGRTMWRELPSLLWSASNRIIQNSLVVLILSAPLSATTTEQQLYEQNYQIQQQKEQIKELEDRAKKYTDDKIEDSSKRVDMVNGSVDRFTTAVTIFGIIITILLVFTAWSSRLTAILEAKTTAKRETKEFLQDWLRNNAEIELQSKVDAMLKNAEIKIDEKVSKKLQEIDAKANKQLIELKKEYTPKEQVEIKKQADISKSKDLGNKTFDDYWSEILDASRTGDNHKAYEIVGQVMTLPNLDDEQNAQLIFAKGFILEDLDKCIEAIKAYNKLKIKYKNSKNKVVLEYIIGAMKNKGVVFTKLSKDSKAVKIFDELINTYINFKPKAIREAVAMVLYNKAIVLEKLCNIEGAINTYNEFNDKYKTSKNKAIQNKVVKAMQNKYELCMINNKSLSEEDNIWIKNAQLNLEDKASFGLLRIIDNAKSSVQDNEVKNWLELYGAVRSKTWGFDALQQWIEKSTYDETTKERIRGYIDIFEKSFRQ